MKIIFTGLESSGKSLKLAMVIADLVNRNSAWYKKSGISRPIWSNLQFSEEFVNYAKDNNVEIHYWENLDDLIKVSQADVVIDEVGNYFDSRMWQDLSLDIRRWLTQGAKSGIEIYGTAQDFAQVDKSFRRLVNELFLIKKLFGSPRPSSTRPPVKRIWGCCMLTELNPQGYEEDKKETKTSWLQIPQFFFIERKYCEIFDTTQKIKRSKYPLLRHEERFCEDPNCTFHKIVHI